MKRFYMLWFILGCSFAALSQTLTIVDKNTAKPIELATLISEQPRLTAETNAKGQVSVSEFKKSTEIIVRAFAYKSIKTTFTEMQTGSFRLEMSPLELSLDAAVVAGTRWKEPASSIASGISSISAKEIALQNPQTAADLLEVSGRVFIQKSQQGGGSPMIRGFATNRLIYTVDGIRMNTAIFRSGNIQNVISLDPFATEETEVLFGPGSVIYGSDAIGGVMSFQTLTPQFSYEDEPIVTGKAVARYSSANSEQTAHFDVNVGWKKWSLLTSFSTWDFDHLRQGRFGPDEYLKPYYIQRQDSTDVIITQEDELLQKPSAYSQKNLLQKLRYKPNEKWDFTYAFHFSETSTYGRYDRHNRLRNGIARYAEWNYGPQVWMMNSLNISHQSENLIYDQMSIRMAHQRFEESRISRDLNSSGREIREEYVDAISVNLDLNKTIGPRNTLYYGVEYVYNDVVSQGYDEDIALGTLSLGPSRYPDAQWQSAAVYVHDEFRATEQLTIQAGARYNLFSIDADFTNNLDFFPLPFERAELQNSSVTGNVGAVFRPGEKWVIRAIAGTAFRAPNVDDIGKIFDSEPGAVTIPNPNLEAEYAYSYDVGVAKIFGNSVKVDFSAYYTILENALVRRNFQLNGADSVFYDGELSQVQALQNAAVANVYGAQFGLEIALPKGFKLSTDLNYQEGEEELEDGTTSPSRHAAPFFGVGRIIYQKGDLNLQFYARYQGERPHDELAVEEQEKDEIYAFDEDGNTFSPSWYTLNLKAMYNVSEYLTVTAGMENLMDQRYRPYSSGISGAGRNFILSLRANF